MSYDLSGQATQFHIQGPSAGTVKYCKVPLTALPLNSPAIKTQTVHVNEIVSMLGKAQLGI